MNTPSILDEICAKIRVALDVKKSARSFDEIFASAKLAADKPSFKSALTRADGGIAVIAELKKASPSRGLIRADFDCAILSAELERAGAAALSVLTEENYFFGSGAYLEKVSSIVKIPLLRKDFIFDEYQICEAKIWGASAVLLIAKMLSESEFKRLFAFAKSLRLDVLAEAHDEREIEMLLDCGADIIGVNCRNLKNFVTDFSISERLLKLIPAGVAKVCESAIEDGAMLKSARLAGADAALVGTALMSEKSPSQKLLRMLEDAR